MKIENEVAGVYNARSSTESQDNQIIQDAIKILDSRIKNKDTLTDPDATKKFLRLKLQDYKSEVFVGLFLDNRHRVIEYRELFFGTIDGASIHPREVVRAVIETNAAAVIFAHNHPSGVSDPSKADILITAKLKDALALIDVRVLDHIIIGEGKPTSLAELGHI